MLKAFAKRVKQEPTTDRELVERAAKGDGDAFGQLYDRYVDDVYHYFRVRVGEVDLAEDLTQDVFMSVYRAMPGFQWQGHFSHWLLRCAHNLMVTHWRVWNRRPEPAPLPEDQGDEAPWAELVADDEDLRAADWHLDADKVLQVMDHLTNLQREVIALRFGLGLSVAETAETMGKTISSIKNLQLGAIAAFRRQLALKDGLR